MKLPRDLVPVKQLMIFQLLLLCTPLGAADPIEVGQDAIVLEESLEVEIASLTDARVRYHERTRILTQQGAAEHSTIGVQYGPGVKVRSLAGSVTHPSGRKVKVGKDSMVDGPAFASYELYSDTRYRALRFPGVVPGSVVEHAYELALSNLRHLPSPFHLQRTDPVRRKTLVIEAPQAFPLRVSVRGETPEYSKQVDRGTVVHRWAVHDVPAFRLDRNTPPAEDLLPMISFQPQEITWDGYRIDATSWSGIARFYWSLSREREIPAPEVARLAREITAQAGTVREKVRAIYEFVQSKINYVSISLGIGGWQPHPNDEVLRYLYGDCKDKATLMIAMLRAVDLTGYAVLIRTRDVGKLDPDSPFLSFNHAIVAVPEGEGYLFLDPTSEDAAFGDLPWQDQGVNVLVVREEGRGELVQTPLFPAERNRWHLEVTGSIGGRGDLEGICTIKAYGQRKSELTSLLELRKTERERFLAHLVSWLTGGAHLTGHEIALPHSPDEPMKITLQFNVSGFVTRAGSIEIVRSHVARLPYLSSLTPYAGREQPFFFKYPFSDLIESRLQLPPGRKLAKLPAERVQEGPGMKSSVRYEMEREEGKSVLVTRRSVSITRREIPVEQYTDLREFVAALESEESRAVRLERGN